MVTVTQSLSFFSLADTHHSTANEQPEQEASTLLTCESQAQPFCPFFLSPSSLCPMSSQSPLDDLIFFFFNSIEIPKNSLGLGSGQLTT